jgi:hypothetical protein
MAFVHFNSAIAGPNFAYQPGDTAEWHDDDEATRFAERGIVELVTKDKAEELARIHGRPLRRHKTVLEAATRGAPERMAAR